MFSGYFGSICPYVVEIYWSPFAVSYSGTFIYLQFNHSTWQNSENVLGKLENIFLPCFYGWGRAWGNGFIGWYLDLWTYCVFSIVVTCVIIISFHMLLPWFCHYVLSISHHISWRLFTKLKLVVYFTNAASRTFIHTMYSSNSLNVLKQVLFIIMLPCS